MLTAAQKELRRTGVTASEIAAVAGLSPWECAHDVWMEKTGRAEEHEDNEHTERGRFIETAIAEWTEYRTGRPVVGYGSLQQSFVHPTNSLVIATPDGFIQNPDEILEIKCPGRRTLHHWGQPESDEIPEYHLAQVTWQMAATSIRKATVARFADGRLEFYHVDFSEKLFRHLLQIAERFWSDYVRIDTPPPVDGSQACSNWLAKRYPLCDAPEFLQSTPDQNVWATTLAQARTMKAQAETLELMAQNKLKEAIGERAGIEGVWGRIYWRNSKPRRITDWDAVCKEVGLSEEIIEKHSKDGAIPRPFRVYLNEDW